MARGAASPAWHLNHGSITTDRFHHVPNPAPRFEVRRFQEFAALPPSCAQLFERCASLQFDQSLEWYGVLAAHALDASQRVCIYVVLDTAQEALAVLPMRYAPRASLLGVRSLQSLATYYSSLYAPIVAPEADSSQARRWRLHKKAVPAADEATGTAQERMAD